MLSDEEKETRRVARLAFSLEASGWSQKYFVEELGHTASEYEEAVEKFDSVYSRPGAELRALWADCYPDAP
tara:strand:+ start:36 stop:248 length:213 start_codon:yes stop_codon:yes gene_type:complete